MKYIAVFDDDFLQNFRRDDPDQLTLVLTGLRGDTRAVRIKPVIRPVCTVENGESVYLSKGHIDALLAYEKKQAVEEFVAKFKEGLGGDFGVSKKM